MAYSEYAAAKARPARLLNVPLVATENTANANSASAKTEDLFNMVMSSTKPKFMKSRLNKQVISLASYVCVPYKLKRAF